MEGKDHVNRYVPTLLDHFSAAVNLDTLCLDMPAMVIQSRIIEFATMQFY